MVTGDCNSPEKSEVKSGGEDVGQAHAHLQHGSVQSQGEEPQLKCMSKAGGGLHRVFYVSSAQLLSQKPDLSLAFVPTVLYQVWPAAQTANPLVGAEVETELQDRKAMSSAGCCQMENLYSSARGSLCA